MAEATGDSRLYSEEIEAAVRREREACATIADLLADHLERKLRRQENVSLAGSRIVAELACRASTAREIAAEIRKGERQR